MDWSRRPGRKSFASPTTCSSSERPRTFHLHRGMAGPGRSGRTLQDRAFHPAGPAHQRSSAAGRDIHSDGCVSGLTRGFRTPWRKTYLLIASFTFSRFSGFATWRDWRGKAFPLADTSLPAYPLLSCPFVKAQGMTKHSTAWADVKIWTPVQGWRRGSKRRWISHSCVGWLPQDHGVRLGASSVSGRASVKPASRRGPRILLTGPAPNAAQQSG